MKKIRNEILPIKRWRRTESGDLIWLNVVTARVLLPLVACCMLHFAAAAAAFSWNSVIKHSAGLVRQQCIGFN